MRIENEKQRIENEKDYIQVSFKLSSAVFRVFTRGQRATVLILLVLIVGFCACAIAKAHWAAGCLFGLLCFFSYLIYSDKKTENLGKKSNSRSLAPPEYYKDE
jgi:hypothetical protein